MIFWKMKKNLNFSRNSPVFVVMARDYLFTTANKCTSIFLVYYWLFWVLYYLILLLCQQLGKPWVRTPALSSEFYHYAVNPEFVDAVGMLRKKNHHSKTETISKILKNYFSHAKIKDLTWQANVQTLDRVSELRAHYPTILEIHLIFFA